MRDAICSILYAICEIFIYKNGEFFLSFVFHFSKKKNKNKIPSLKNYLL